MANNKKELHSKSLIPVYSKKFGRFFLLSEVVSGSFIAATSEKFIVMYSTSCLILRQILFFYRFALEKVEHGLE